MFPGYPPRLTSGTLHLGQLHPFCQQREIVDYCHKNDIIVQAYSPLVRAQKGMFDHSVVTAIANKHGKDNAQVLIRWNLQKGCDLCVFGPLHHLLTVMALQMGDPTKKLRSKTDHLKCSCL